MQPHVDLNAVAIFSSVVQQRSFRAAAKALDIPRSTVSLKVAELEKQLGVRLLDRTTRVVRPTDAGRTYLASVLPALESLGEAARSLADLQGTPSGVIRVTAPPELGQFLFGRVLSAYRDRYPQVRVQIDLTARRVDLVEDGYDVAVRAGELADSALIARPLGPPQRLPLCASPAYLRRRGLPRHPSELREHDCLVMNDRQEPTRWEFRDGRQRVLVRVEPHVAINSFVVLRDLALSGHGITWLPHFLARPCLRDRTLRELLVPFRPPDRSYHALYPSSRRFAAKVRTFIEVLAAQAETLLG